MWVLNDSPIITLAKVGLLYKDEAMNDVERLQKACNAVKDDPKRHEMMGQLLKIVANAGLQERKSEKFHSTIFNHKAFEHIATIRPRDGGKVVPV